MATTTSSSTSSTPGMAPDTQATKDTLTTSTNANFLITAYAHALLNTQIVKISGQGSWYDTFNANLLVAQQHAQLWVETLGPQVFGTVPQAIINYSNTFTLATNDILDILSKIQGVPTAAQQTQINQLIDAVLAQLTEEQTTIQQIQASLQNFATDVQNDHTNLLTGQNSAEQQVLIDQTELAKIQAKINGIQDKIKSDSQKAMYSEIGLGVAIFVMVVGIALAVATGGATAPLVVAGVGLLGIGGAIAGTVIFSQDVSKDYDDLSVQMQAYSDEQKQVAALQGITNSIDSLVQANEAATQAISSVLDTWATLSIKLTSVSADLQKAEAKDVPAIIESLDLQAAQAAWNQLVDFAQGMQKSAQSITVQPVQQPKAA